MKTFESYFLMEPEDVMDYVCDKLPQFKEKVNLECREIGDGNLNYVFKVWDKNDGTSVIVKQAGHTARISDDFKLSTNRNRIESNVLKLQGELAPGLVPEMYLYDDVMSCCVMEDLSDHTILRTALNNGEIFPCLADHLTTFLANNLLLTSDVVMDHKKKKELVKDYSNPELCEITEDLVYSEPFNDYKGRNQVSQLNKGWVEKNIYKNDKLKLEAAKLKFTFLTKAQALLHGDFHTGSMFVKKDSTKLIDPEFAFYGPMGYDVGNIIANLIFAWTRADAIMEPGEEKRKYMKWLEETIEGIIDQFSSKFLSLWEKHATDTMANEQGFDQWYLSTVKRDTAGVAGLELIRRIVGLAKVTDITTISDDESRARAERICLGIAQSFILEADSYQTGSAFIECIMKESILQEIR